MIEKVFLWVCRHFHKLATMGMESIWSPIIPHPIDMADDLGKALLGLTNGIRSTMANVHSLNIAVLNSSSHYSMHGQCTSLRNDLKLHWADDVSNLLQQIYGAIGDLIFLTKSVGQESEQECYTFFQETIQSVADIETSCRTCISRNAEVTKNLQLTISQFMGLRHRHSFDVSVRHSSSYSSGMWITLP